MLNKAYNRYYTIYLKFNAFNTYWCMNRKESTFTNHKIHQKSLKKKYGKDVQKTF